MAISAPPLLLLLLSLLAVTSSARPCRTFFYFSATTTTISTTYYPHHSLPANPNPNSAQNPHYVAFIFTTTHKPFSSHRPSLNFNSDSHSSPAMTSSSSGFPLNFYSTVSSSIRDRTKDILSVVGALLFGVGCGALTGALMYFLWALFAPGRFDFNDLSDEEEEEDDVAAAKKKLGYVAIPAMADDVKNHAPPAKEVV
ncbi:hypothetical protein SASPL_106763 [Salvia splendens]|uniref:Uncharacterized protein n=1 Tax=Salvia splendens TaxID=180675 RepID=A0A8X8YR85_SALSN|nr:uncharacterized protein LOC121780312 [Salvia splendens]KAG6435112.1 hypothetical protein SASPL_106763 [Salvia splendens]